MKYLRISCLAVGLALSGCGCRTAPITLSRYAHIDNVSEFTRHAIAVIHAEGCEVDTITYGCRNGTFMRVTITGRYKTNAEICSERMYEYRDRMRQAEEALRARAADNSAASSSSAAH